MTVSFFLSYAALWALVVFQTLVLLGLVRTVYRLRREGAALASDGDLRGHAAPEFSAFDLSGAPIRSTDLAERLSALLFVGPDCGSCGVTLADFDALNCKARGNVIVFCQGVPEECSRLIQTYRLDVPVVADQDLKISELFRIHTVPTAVLIEGGRVVRTGHPKHGEELEKLMEKQAELQLRLEEVH